MQKVYWVRNNDSLKKLNDDLREKNGEVEKIEMTSAGRDDPNCFHAMVVVRYAPGTIV